MRKSLTARPHSLTRIVGGQHERRQREGSQAKRAKLGPGRRLCRMRHRSKRYFNYSLSRLKLLGSARSPADNVKRRDSPKREEADVWADSVKLAEELDECWMSMNPNADVSVMCSQGGLVGSSSAVCCCWTSLASIFFNDPRRRA